MRRTTSSWLSTIEKLGFKRSRRRSTGLRRSALGTYSRRLAAESLEERRLLAATHFVTTLIDESYVANEAADGTGLSLREAIGMAASDDIIKFDAALTSEGPATIRLDIKQTSDSAIEFSKGLTIEGPGANLLTVDAGGINIDPTPDSLPFDSSTGINGNDGDGRRIFRLTGSASTVVNISGLTLTGGDLRGNKGGGAIRSQVNLTLDGVYIVDNAAYSINATDPQGQGGGIYQAGGTLLVKNSTIAPTPL